MYGQLEIDLKAVPSGSRLYINVSGGIDSSYLAWRLLQAGHPLLIHHCEYRTRQNRWRKEGAAYRAVLDWYADQGLTDWKLLTTQIDFHDSMGYWHHDIDYLMWVSGMLLRNPERHDIRYVIRATNADDPRPGSSKDKRRAQIINLQAERNIQFVYPMRRYTKAQIIQDMPEPLLARAWWCRKPKDGQPCGACHTCKLVAPAIEAIGGGVE